MVFAHLGLSSGVISEVYSCVAVGLGRDDYTLTSLGSDARLAVVLAQHQVP